MTTQQAQTRFGTIDFTDQDVVQFAEPILGFPDSSRFVLVHIRDDSPFRWLQSVDEPEVSFLVVDPAHYFAEYAPLISNADALSLGLTENTPRLVYTIASIPPGRPEDMTLNLAAPVVINLEKGWGRQLILERENYAIRQRVFEPQDQVQQTAAA